MAKDKNVDAMFCIDKEDLGNWVVSLVEEFTENDDLNDYIFSSIPEDCELSDEQAEMMANIMMSSLLAGVQIGIMDALDEINAAVAEGACEFNKIAKADNFNGLMS